MPQVRYLKIIEKSGYQALPWVRYITQNGGTCSPLCGGEWGCQLRGSLVAEQLPPGWLPLGWHAWTPPSHLLDYQLRTQ